MFSALSRASGHLRLKVRTFQNSPGMQSLKMFLFLILASMGREGGSDEWVQEYKQECRQERIELQELKENLWRWRKQGGGGDKNRKTDKQKA